MNVVSIMRLFRYISTSRVELHAGGGGGGGGGGRAAGGTELSRISSIESLLIYSKFGNLVKYSKYLITTDVIYNYNKQFLNYQLLITNLHFRIHTFISKYRVLHSKV